MHTPFESGLSRRRFIGGAVAAAVASSSHAWPASAQDTPPTFTRKIKLGVIGNGGRGGWIAKLCS